MHHSGDFKGFHRNYVAMADLGKTALGVCCVPHGVRANLKSKG